MRFKTLICVSLAGLAGLMTAGEANAGGRHRLHSAGSLWPFLLNFGTQVLRNELPQLNTDRNTGIPPALSDPVPNVTITSIETKLTAIESKLNITTSPQNPLPPTNTEIVVPGTPPQRPNNTGINGSFPTN